jgi:hypothetical protein
VTSEVLNAYLSIAPPAPAVRIFPTLPLSGRQGVAGGEAESWWWPDHSKGLFGILQKREDYILPSKVYNSKFNA